MERQPRDLVVITGASRGIGKATALALAKDFDILGTFVDWDKEARIKETQAEVGEMGGVMGYARVDLTSRMDRGILTSTARSMRKPGQNVHLVLNAAGGYEENKGDYWARKINTDAQMSLVKESFLGILTRGSVIVYPTSIYAHGFLPDYANGFRQFVQPPAYYMIGESKYTTERKLLEGAQKMDANFGIRIGFPIGQIVEGTSANTLFKRYFKQRLAEMTQYSEGGKLPDAAAMGEAVRDILMGAHETGYRVFVGGNKAEEVDPGWAGEWESDREDIHQTMPMYGDNKLYGDLFRSPRGSKRFGELDFTVRDIDVEGHFAGEYSDIQVFRGSDQLELGGHAIALTLLSIEPNATFVPFLQEGHIKLLSPVEKGDKVTAKAEVTSYTGKTARGKARLYVGERAVSEVTDVQAAVIPNIETARRLIKQQRAK